MFSGSCYLTLALKRLLPWGAWFGWGWGGLGEDMGRYQWGRFFQSLRFVKASPSEPSGLSPSGRRAKPSFWHVFVAFFACLVFN